MMSEHYLGIDVAKKQVSATIVDAAGKIVWRKDSIANTVAGVRYLLTHIPRPLQTRVAFEATGVYTKKLERGLSAKVQAVYLLNPRVLKRASLQITQTKTDPADSEQIAQFLRQFLYLEPERISAWMIDYVPAKESLRLVISDYRKRVDGLQRIRARVDSLRSDGSTKAKELIFDLQEDILHFKERLTRRKLDVVEAAECLDRSAVDLMASIPGIGRLSASVFLGRIVNISRFQSVDQLKAYLGIYPVKCQSGDTKKRTRLARHGCKLTRFQLYNCARTACKRNPLCVPLYDRLREAGHSGNDALGAVMRKLIHIIYGVLKTRTPFSPLGKSEVAGGDDDSSNTEK